MQHPSYEHEDPSWRQIDEEIAKEQRIKDALKGMYVCDGQETSSPKLNAKAIHRQILSGKRKVTLNEIICKLSYDFLDIYLYWRECLKCENKFVAKGRYRRVCAACKYTQKEGI